jgi:hypothetical protein
MATWFDDSRHPLHVMRFPPSYTYEELDESMTALRAYYHRYAETRPNEAMALLIDLSAVKTSSAKNRARINECLKQLRAPMARACAGQAYVVRNQVVRAALSTILLMHAAPWPVRVVVHAESAERWLLERVGERQPELEGL